MRFVRVLSIFLCIFFIAGKVGAAEAYLTREESKTLSKGVIHRSIELFTPRGWVSAQVIEVDYNTPGLSIKALTDKRGISYRDNVLSLGKQYENVLAAINADFFQPASGKADRGAPVGVVVEDGKLLSTPALGGEMAAVFDTDFKKIAMGYWGVYTEVVAPDGEALPVAHINKFFDEGGLVIYTRAWGQTSPGAWLTKYELLVVDGVVADIREGGEGFEIPENGYVLASTSDEYEFLRERFEIGSAVLLNSFTEPRAEDVNTALGGGTLLVKDGAAAPITHNAPGLSPRSAVGVDESGTRLFIVAVDGRQDKSVGMTLGELSSFMLSLGCYSALNFDGGGSTALAARAMGGELETVNSPSEALRRVSNALGLVHDFPYDDRVYSIELSGGGNVFAGGSVSIFAKAYNEYYLPLEIDEGLINWSVSGVAGEVSGGVFRPETSGAAVITASYAGVSASLSVKVLGEPRAIVFSPENIAFVKGAAANVSAFLADGGGFTAPIDISNLEFETGGAAKIEGGKIIMMEKGVIKARFKNAEGYLGIGAGGLVGSVVADDFENSAAKAAVYPETVAAGLSFTDEESRSGKAAKLWFDFSGEEPGTKAAYLNYGSAGVALPEGAAKLGIWACPGERAPYALRAEFKAGDGAIFRAQLAQNLDWEGFRYLEADIPEGLSAGAVLWRVYAVDIGGAGGGGYVYFDDLTFVGGEGGAALPKTAMPDEYRVADIGGLKIGVFGTGKGEGRLIDRLFANKVMHELNKRADIAIFLGEADEGALSAAKIPVFAGGGYSYNEFSGCAVITVDNKKGGIRAANADQWYSLISDLGRGGDLIISLTAPFNGGFDDKAERELFCQVLENAAAGGRRIFVVSPGEENEFSIKNNVRYITAGGTRAIGADFARAAENCEYTLFNLGERGTTYVNMRVIAE